MSKMQDIATSAAEKRAEGYEFEVVMGSPTLLTIDLDTEDAIAAFDKRLEILQQRIACRRLDCWPSKNGGQHVVVILDVPMDWQKRAMFQAFLGSDPTRELLGYFNVNNKGSEPFCLFKPKGRELA